MPIRWSAPASGSRIPASGWNRPQPLRAGCQAGGGWGGVGLRDDRPSGTLLDAQLGHVQARIDAQTAETRLLAAVGALADRYGERVAQTPDDRQRIAQLRRTGGMVTFGGPL